MQIDVITIFPEMFPRVLGASIVKRAQVSGRLTIRVHDLRRYTHDKRRTVDDRPYGGGPGMVMKVEPIAEALEDLQRRFCGAPQAPPVAPAIPPRVGRHPAPPMVPTSPCGLRPEAVGRWRDGAPRVQSGGLHSVPRLRSGRRGHTKCQTILLSPQGTPLSSVLAQELAGAPHLILICGHYEGVDERVRAALTDRSVSIGDYVLTGGELPAMVLIDCVARFIPSVIGHADATKEESFAAGWLEYPQYTRPSVFRGLAVPDILLSGNHAQVAKWRTGQSIARTAATRPDLITSAQCQAPLSH